MAAITKMGNLDSGTLESCGVLGDRVAKLPGVLQCMEYGKAEDL